MSKRKNAISINMSSKEIDSHPSIKHKIPLKDLVLITMKELSKEIEKNDLVSVNTKEYKDLDRDIKLFLDIKNDKFKSLRLLIFNENENDVKTMREVKSELNKIGDKINKTISRYYGKLVFEMIRENVGYIVLKLTKDKIYNENWYLSDDARYNLKMLRMKEESEIYNSYKSINVLYESLEDRYDPDKEKKKGLIKSANDYKNEENIGFIRKIIKSIYGLKDEDFVDGKFLPIISKALARLVGMIAVVYGTNRIANKTVMRKSGTKEVEVYNKKKDTMETKKKNTGMKTVIVSLITLFAVTSTFAINKAIKKGMRDAQKKRLKVFYEDKLDYLDDKIDKAENPEEKYYYNTLRSKLLKDVHKIDMTLKNENKNQ